MWGLEHSDLTSVTSSKTVVSRISRYSYGMSFSQIYDSRKNIAEDKHMDAVEGIY